jgi:hypothetical protein
MMELRVLLKIKKGQDKNPAPLNPISYEKPRTNILQVLIPYNTPNGVFTERVISANER